MQVIPIVYSMEDLLDHFHLNMIGNKIHLEFLQSTVDFWGIPKDDGGFLALTLNIDYNNIVL